MNLNQPLTNIQGYQRSFPFFYHVRCLTLVVCIYYFVCCDPFTLVVTIRVVGGGREQLYEKYLLTIVISYLFIYMINAKRRKNMN